MIILDTNIVSEPLRIDPEPAVVEWLDAQADETLYLTTVTLGELRYGIAALPAGRRKQVLDRRVENEVFAFFDDRVLPFDEPASRAYGELRAAARAAGRPVGDLDALIAAIAVSRGFAVASRDTGPFQAAGVEVINPFSR